MGDEQDERDDQQDPNDLGGDPDVPIVHLPSPEHSHSTAEKASHGKHYIKRSIEALRPRWPSATKWTAIAALVAAAATTVYAVYAYKQWNAMNGQLGQMMLANT